MAEGRRESTYTVLAREVRNRILQGDYADGRRLPTEAELASRHQVSRQTVTLEPVPTNLRAAGASEAGLRQSILAYNGQIKPYWTGNANATGADVYTATVVTSAGCPARPSGVSAPNCSIFSGSCVAG